MRVKIGDKWFDGNEQPVMVELTDSDKQNIANMLPHCTKYAMFPDNDHRSTEDMKKWMSE